jgi:hypothetical protein
MKTCEYCAHYCPWRNERTGRVTSPARGVMGDCRAHAPVVVQPQKWNTQGEPRSFTRWPAVSENDYCGDWQSLAAAAGLHVSVLSLPPQPEASPLAA